MPEPTAPSLEIRRQQEEASWARLCSHMGTNVKPVTITRLARKPDSPHVSKPRLLRVALATPEDVEKVLLAAYILKGKVEERIFADIPWQERQRVRQMSIMEERAERDKRAIFVHGVPESTDPDTDAKYQHDCQEWQFIQTLIGTQQLITTEVIRIPSSAPGDRRDPRLLKIMLLTPDMAITCLQAWRACRKTVPPELRLQAARKSPASRTEVGTREPGVQSHQPGNPLTDEPNQPKNGAQPANVRPAKPLPPQLPIQDFSPPRTYAAVTQTRKGCEANSQN